jgi:hypothetical protein
LSVLPVHQQEDESSGQANDDEALYDAVILEFSRDIGVAAWHVIVAVIIQVVGIVLIQVVL